MMHMRSSLTAILVFLLASQAASAGDPVAACCLGSDCDLLTQAECADQGGHFVAGAVFCAASVCATGACCTPEQCIDTDGDDGPMDEELCDELRGKYKGGGTCGVTDSCAFHRIPEGYEVVEVTPGMENRERRGPRINNCGEIVFHMTTPVPPRCVQCLDIYLYDNGALYNVTDDDRYDVWPDINDDGTIAWSVNVRGVGHFTSLCRDGEVTILGNPEWVGWSGASPAINARAHVAWDRWIPPVYNEQSNIMLYDGVSVRAVFDDGGTPQQPQINDRDEIVWTDYDFTGGLGGWTSDILHYADGGISVLPSSLTQCQAVHINDVGVVVWSCAFGIELWDGQHTEVVVAGPKAGRLVAINDSSDLAFQRAANGTPWQIWIRHRGAFMRISSDDDTANHIENGEVDINDHGEVVWRGLPNGAWSPSWTWYMRRIRTGDVDLDNDVDRADFAYFPGCYTGSIPTDRLCQCRFLDIDHDRDVDDDDFTLFMQNYTGPLEDCNGNGTLDFEDILYSDTPDCNQNGIPDSCDLSGGTSLDADGDGVVDDFAAKKVKTPWLEIFPIWTNRYLHMIPRNQGIKSAIRVTLVEVNGFGDFDGHVRWVGPPAEYPEEDSSDPQRMFTAAPLQCEPHFMDWSIVDDLYVFGAEIVPGSSYEIQEIGMGCAVNLDDQSAYSEFPVTIRTGKWGDVAEPFATAEGAAAQPDFTDVAALVNKFTADPAGLNKSFTQLQPNTPDPSQPIDFSDIANVVDAFSGSPYPFAGPTECP